MTDQLPAWISAPTRRQRQTEAYLQWRSLMRERLRRHPPAFLRHLSEPEIDRLFDFVDHANGMTGGKAPSPLLFQLCAYEHQLELIAWSYFSLMGNELRALKEKLSPDDFIDTLNKIGLSLEEARLALLVAETHQSDQTESSLVPE